MHYCLEGQVAENFEGLLSDCRDIVFALHFSDGRIKYTLNKNSVNIEIPLPFGGKSSKDLKMLETIRTPALNLHPVGFHLPSQEFQVPAFTIPKLYQLRVPLLGVLDLSTNTYSNLYNWSASYTGGNTSTDPLSLQAQCHVKADAVVDLLSYHVQGEPCPRGGSQSEFAAGSNGLASSRKGKTWAFLQTLFLLLGTLFFFLPPFLPPSLSSFGNIY